MCLFAFFIGPSVDKTSSDWIESTIAYYVFVTLSSGGGGSSWDLCRDLLGYLAKKEIALAASEQSFPDRVAEKRQEAKMHSAITCSSASWRKLLCPGYTADVIFVMTPQGPKIARDYCDKKVRFLMAHTKWTKEIPRIGVHFTEALEFEISFPQENLVWMELFQTITQENGSKIL